MKKIICFALVIIMMLTLCACGNQSIGLGNYTFAHIHIDDNINSYCAEVEKWFDVDRGIEIKTKEFGSIFCSEGTYILFENGNDCPFCE